MHPLALTMDVECAIARILGQPHPTKLQRDHVARPRDLPSGCDTQPPLGMVYPPRFTRGGRGIEGPRQIVRYVLFFPFESLTVLFASDRLERILRQLSKATVSAINAAQPQHKPIHDVLFDLARSKNRPRYLVEMAYEWCSVIYENRQRLGNGKLLPLALQTGFRHLDPQHQWIPANLIHTEHHRKLADVVFGGDDGEVIADLLHAWTSRDYSREPAYTLLSICTGHLADLPNRVELSFRLRRLVIRTIELSGYKRFEEVGTERFIELLNHLHVGIGDMDSFYEWMLILLETIKFSEGVRHLSIHSWELLEELATSYTRPLEDSGYSPQVTASLLEIREWDKLECWMGVVWMVWPPQTDMITEDLERAMVLLFHQRPGAVRKLTQWMERYSGMNGEEVPEAFQRICEQSPKPAQLDAPYVPFVFNGYTESHAGHRFLVGRIHHLVGELRNLLVSRPLEATRSGSRYL